MAPPARRLARDAGRKSVKAAAEEAEAVIASEDVEVAAEVGAAGAAPMVTATTALELAAEDVVMIDLI